jgi:hypothetical protein
MVLSSGPQFLTKNWTYLVFFLFHFNVPSLFYLPLLPFCPSKMCIMVLRHILVLLIQTSGPIMHIWAYKGYQVSINKPKTHNMGQNHVQASSIFLEKEHGSSQV